MNFLPPDMRDTNVGLIVGIIGKG